MKTISVREFQLKASEELEDLPFVLTRYNKPVAIVKRFPEEGNSLEGVSIEDETPSISRRGEESPTETPSEFREKENPSENRETEISEKSVDTTDKSVDTSLVQIWEDRNFMPLMKEKYKGYCRANKSHPFLRNVTKEIFDIMVVSADDQTVFKDAACRPCIDWYGESIKNTGGRIQ